MSEARLFSTLAEVNDALTGSRTPRAGVQRALAILTPLYGVLRVSVVLKDPGTASLTVEASEGLTPRGQRARWKVGEGVTGRVVQTGRPVVIPRIDQEPMLLHRTRPRETSGTSETSFMCVPIFGSDQAIGALNIDLPFAPARDYAHDLELFRVVATMLGQALRVTQLVEAAHKDRIEENRHLRAELQQHYDFSHIIGDSASMRHVFDQVTRVAPSNATVLIRGESGTGKELIAHAIHYNSPRATKPFIKVSCAALPDSLIEAELFGYERGAFTGAAGRKDGRFAWADGGTLFLDEIGDINLSTQVKLLRVLQEREYTRLGGTASVKTNVRLVAATNADLEAAIAAGTFREDLYYRLNVFSLHIPPLRERKTDILLLADSFLERYAVEHHKRVRRIATLAIDMLMAYHWPGNVRELENAIERAVLVCDGQAIEGCHLPPTLQTADATGTLPSISLAAAVAAYERDLIEDALRSTRGNRVRAGKLLDATERVISYKVKKYGIDCARFRNVSRDPSY